MAGERLAQIGSVNFTYQAGSRTKARRVVAKVEWHPGELYPRVVLSEVDTTSRAAVPQSLGFGQNLACQTSALLIRGVRPRLGIAEQRHQPVVELLQDVAAERGHRG